MRVLLYLLFVAVAGQLSAQMPTQLKDIFPGEDNSSPTRFFQYGDRALFRAETPDEGVELWITDGTPEGTQLLKDINTDPSLSRGNSNPDGFTEYKGKVYFKARSAGFGDELWVTDGTPDGTVMLKDIQVGEGNANPFDFIIYNDLLYFTANDGVVSSELWVTDGTEAGTNLVVDIRDGNSPGNPNFKTIFQDKLYFTANDGVDGNELWMSDGTAAGTMLVKDIRDGGNGSPSQYFVVDDLMYFRANDGNVGTELWVTDGTTAGTILLSDIRDGSGSSSPSDFFRVGDNVFFAANPGTGKDLFVITPENLLPVSAGLNAYGGGADPREVTEIIANQSYFVLADTSDSDTSSIFFIISDVRGQIDIDDQPLQLDPFSGTDPDDLVWTGNALYFSYEADSTGRELAGFSFVDDGDAIVFDEVVAGPTSGDIDDIFLLGNRLLFEADDDVTGRELWVADIKAAYISPTTADDAPLMEGDTIFLGSVTVGLADSITVNFPNSGNANAVLFVDFSELPDDPFTVPSINGRGNLLRLPTMDTSSLDVVYTPITTGDNLDSIQFSFTTGAGPQSVSFYIQATGVVARAEVSEAGTVLTDGATLSFTDVAERTDSTRTLVLRNAGEGALVVGSVALATGTVFNVTEVADTLASGETLAIPVTYSPTDVSTATDVLTITTAAGDFTVNLSGMSIVNSIVDRGLPARAVYPNPTGGRVTLELTAALNQGEWRVVNASGQVVSQGAWPAGSLTHDVDMTQLPAGIYQLEVNSGNRRVTARVMRR